MDLTKNIGFICRTENEWFQCQEILLKNGYHWHIISGRMLNIPTNASEFEFLMLFINSKGLTPIHNINSLQNKRIYWCTLKNYREDMTISKLTSDEDEDKDEPATLYEASKLIRKYKLEKLNEF